MLDPDPMSFRPAPSFTAREIQAITAQQWVAGVLVIEDVDVHEPAALQVEVDVTHPHAGGLALWLQAPGGSYYRLHTSDGRDLDAPLPPSYEVDVSHEYVDGTWRLWLYDAYSHDEGRLTRWQVTF
ncbi:proprotein convertase P-domain-containing protein [Luteipulveratus sp. YIM 133132]|uniref:Proprotein convertase P-domain-containing protein n=1 Tax=Luteipulveratus flavus TaxID=3031728 RepID=A0ABT6C4Z3_9MICO|nr:MULTISPECIES: proprotein convertase P-domain-containing protein [unclassified Luteipulveratus]MDE9364477.1 proprotein convertase P-domain-containing protein [Luteipulveratus sp. YIM 133132]MDF8264016.1 proprotein convertase P-domain-containing protein [Luteipulveratus sp. YIM 133296]